MKRRLCGPHAVAEALRAGATEIAIVYAARSGGAETHRAILEQARRASVVVELCDTRALDQLAHGVRHQGIIAISDGDYPYIDVEALVAAAATPALIVALDEIQDPHNFGAIVRSAVAFGADGVITLRHRAAPVSAVVVRASAGATEHARIARATNLVRAIEVLADAGIQSLGLDADAPVAIGDVDLRVPTVVVVGSEGVGLRRLVRERCSVIARIPMAGPLGSLNASVAAALALYEAVRQRRGAALR